MIQEQQIFDAGEALERVRSERTARRRRTTWGKSRLAPYRVELVKLRAAGGSLSEIVFWLRSQKRIKVSDTTVMRYLSKLPEMGNKNG